MATFRYIVTAIYSSVAAFDLFKVDPQNFDVIVTDQTMSELTGGELAQKIIDIRPDISIILCTGHGNTMDARKSGYFETHFLSDP